MSDPQPKKSDLGVRVASAVVMVVVAGAALWLGGWALTALVLLTAAGVLWEWWQLIRSFVVGSLLRTAWILGGIVYVGGASWVLWLMRNDPPDGPFLLVAVVFGVIGTDIGAFFVGRAIGGPKIAPSISPSKTWAGLGGGILGAATSLTLAARLFGVSHWPTIGTALISGALIATVAQAGDFFESWMKRRAGVKDSGRLIPGHGGLFDRVDGLIAVLFAIGVLSLFLLLPSI